jgi:hypothetical protein
MCDESFLLAIEDPSVPIRYLTLQSETPCLDHFVHSLSHSDSNVIDESDIQFETHDEQRTSTFRGITIV